MVKQAKHAETVESWLAHVAQTRSGNDLALLNSAVQIYNDQQSPLLKKGIGIADILFSLDLDTETLAAAIIYPAVVAHEIHYDIVSERFGDKVKKMLIDALQMQSLDRFTQITQRQENQIENLRKILLAMVTDIRAVLTILAERLLLLREAKSLPIEMQKKMAEQSMKIYAPLANRLGVWQLKWEIEDMCLRYLDPDMYKQIAKGLAAKRDEREQYIIHAIKELSDVLTKNHIKDFSVNGRIKHIYSIYSKMRRKGTDLDKIYDITAMRVLVPDVDTCYSVMSILHHAWKPFHLEFDDYISKPKANGYQSIHTVIFGPDDRMVEVQIRTYKMHEAAELGVASHWRYKENIKSTSQYEEKIALLRQVMAWQKEISHQDAKPAEATVKDLFADRVYVFTPLGDIIDLPKNATPLDFAYTIHSEVGHRCRGAKVNGKLVQLTHPLQTGDQIEIMTSKEPHPSRDWLNPHKGYITTQRARAHVQHWFKAQDVAEKPAPEIKPIKKLKPDRNLHHLHDIHVKPVSPANNIGSLLTKFARCCKPLPGDNVIGYITQKQGLSLHRLDCNNIRYLRDKYPERFLEITAKERYQGSFPADLEIIGMHDAKLLHTITTTLANAGVHIVAISEKSSPKKTNIDFLLSINIKTMSELDKVVALLTQIPTVLEVRRI